MIAVLAVSHIRVGVQARSNPQRVDADSAGRALVEGPPVAYYPVPTLTGELMETGGFDIYSDKRIEATELATLMASVGWGTEGDYDPAAVERSLAAYPFVAYARDHSGSLVGYVSAFSDGVFSTFIGELVVRPEAQRRGLGSELLRRVEQRYPGVPVYVQSFADVEGFFQRRGYRVGVRAQSVLFKIPA